MKRNQLFLSLGIALSVCSKVLQFLYHSLWGDVLILFAAVFFVLAILLYIPHYRTFLQGSHTQGRAKILALLCCCTVLCFQLFTMLTFGKAFWWGLFFLPLFLVLVGICVFMWVRLQKATQSE